MKWFASSCFYQFNISCCSYIDNKRSLQTAEPAKTVQEHETSFQCRLAERATVNTNLQVSKCSFNIQHANRPGKFYVGQFQKERSLQKLLQKCKHDNTMEIELQLKSKEFNFFNCYSNRPVYEKAVSVSKTIVMKKYDAVQWNTKQHNNIRGLSDIQRQLFCGWSVGLTVCAETTRSLNSFNFCCGYVWTFEV